ncbi:UNVERIFIED_CONTAM: hypothetical protein HDU68_004250 [Siphonaria sp. JEL0065]|nr:hypothetical protein HDU68_004250 [Siphonaria sp. JEL0065]
METSIQVHAKCNEEWLKFIVEMSAIIFDTGRILAQGGHNLLTKIHQFAIELPTLHKDSAPAPAKPAIPITASTPVIL